MSASFHWCITEKGRYIPANAPSSAVQAMRLAFGESPWTLGDEQLPVLRGMAATGHDELYKRLIETIESMGEIRLWVEW